MSSWLERTRFKLRCASALIWLCAFVYRASGFANGVPSYLAWLFFDLLYFHRQSFRLIRCATFLIRWRFRICLSLIYLRTMSKVFTILWVLGNKNSASFDTLVRLKYTQPLIFVCWTDFVFEKDLFVHRIAFVNVIDNVNSAVWCLENTWIIEKLVLFWLVVSSLELRKV